MKPITLLAVLAASAMAGHWDIEQVDSADWGAAVDMRWHPDGRLFLCYSDTSGIIRLASKDSIWSYENLPQWHPALSGTQGFDIDRHGRIGVSYASTDGRLRCALKTDTDWVDIQTPFSLEIPPCLITLDTAGAPAITIPTRDAYLLARLRDTFWASETLATGYSGFSNAFVSSALGSMADGTIWGVFLYSFEWPACYIHGDALCSFQVRDSGTSVTDIRTVGGGTIGGASGCVDQHGAVHSCYNYWLDETNGMFLDQTQIDSESSARTNAVKYDSLDRPQIAYVTGGDTLMYRYLDSGVWHIFGLRTTAVTALSLAIDENSEPLIAYTTSDGVFLAHGVGVTGQSEDRQQPTPIGRQLTASVVRNVLLLPEASSRKPKAACCLLDAAGRRALDLHPGANDVSSLAPGVYFVREAQAQAVRKVIIAR